MELFSIHKLKAVKAWGRAMALTAIALFASADAAQAYRKIEKITLYSAPNSSATNQEITDGAEIQELLVVGRDMVKVRTSKGTGWIKNSQYQKLDQPDHNRSLVLQRTTELRTRGGMSGEVKSTLGQGAVIREILFKGDHWYKVATDKGTGWVRKDVVEKHTTAAGLAAINPCHSCDLPKIAPPISAENIKPIVDIAQKLEPKPKAEKPVPIPVAKPEVRKPEERKPASASTAPNCALQKILSSAKRVVATKYNNRPKSRGVCARGVRDSLQASRVGSVQGGLGNAYDYTWTIKSKGFDKLETTDITKAPPGAVIVFSGPYTSQYLKTGYEGPRGRKGYWVGHVTIKGDDGYFYTDGRERDAAVGWSGSRNVRNVRNVAAIYVPSAATVAKTCGSAPVQRLAQADVISAEE